MKPVVVIFLLFICSLSFGQNDLPILTPDAGAMNISLKSQRVLSKKNLFTYGAVFKKKSFDKKDTIDFGENHYRRLKKPGDTFPGY
jgi:hypothetical protein